jgi:hypothetical protein
VTGSCSKDCWTECVKPGTCFDTARAVEENVSAEWCNPVVSGPALCDWELHCDIERPLMYGISFAHYV